jgi:hypothetical protein
LRGAQVQVLLRPRAGARVFLLVRLSGLLLLRGAKGRARERERRRKRGGTE